jgi:glycosyltransferase involved in cell wall biosynthesis
LAGVALRLAGGCALVMDSDDWEGPGGWNDDPRTGYSGLQKRFFAWQERDGLSHADAWTVASECLRQRAIAFGAAAERVFVLHNGISELPELARSNNVRSDDFSHPARHSAAEVVPASETISPAGDDRSNALLYTRFAGVHPADVTAIWAQVRAIRPDARLMVVGRGVAGEEQGLIGAPGITVAGWVEPEHLPALFAQNQIALAPWRDTPSNRARHSAKILELMAAGLPIVASAVGELPATLGDAGVLTPPGDLAAFGREAAALLADEERGRRLGAAARARVAEHFTWERLAQVALAAYERAMEA